MKLQMDPNRLYAIALEGGGAKGAYQIGVWKALEEAGIRYNAVSGSSVGSLNGAIMASHELDKAIAFWQNIRFSQVMNVDDAEMRRVFDRDFAGLDLKKLVRNAMDTVRQGGFDVEPLRRLLREQIDEDKVRSSDVNFYLMTYSLTDHRELDIDAKTLADGELYDMLLASAYFPAFKHEKLGGKRYTDGGVQDVVPIHSLTSRGYRDIIVIRIFGVGVERRFRMPDDVNLITIAPNRDLGSVLNFSAEQSRVNMRLGYFDGMRALYGLYGKTYYIDRTMDEPSAYRALYRMALCHDPAQTLRTVNESGIPALARLTGGSGEYYDVLVAVLEQAAEAVSVEPFAVYTDAELLKRVCGKAPYGDRRKNRVLAYLPAAWDAEDGTE